MPWLTDRTLQTLSLGLPVSKDTLLVEREVVLGQHAEHLAEVLVMNGGIVAVHHNVIQVE